MVNKGKKITIEYIAKRAGVSVASVSRVINGHIVTEPVKNKVNVAINEIGSDMPQSLLLKRKKGQKFIAVFILDILNPFYATLVKGIEDILNIHQYNLILCDTKNYQLNQQNESLVP